MRLGLGLYPYYTAAGLLSSYMNLRKIDPNARLHQTPAGSIASSFQSSMCVLCMWMRMWMLTAQLVVLDFLALQLLFFYKSPYKLVCVGLKFVVVVRDLTWDFLYTVLYTLDIRNYYGDA